MREVKSALRAKFSKRRMAMPPQHRDIVDQMIARNVCALWEFQSADALLAYMAFRGEVPTRGIIAKAWEAGKTVFLPRCMPDSREMAFYQVNSFDELEKGSYGILEPRTEGKEPAKAFGAHALCLVPALTFDGNGHRLGYGGGYYDRFLAGFSGTAVGLCRMSQMSYEPLGLEEHDVPVDLIVTESGVMHLD